MSEDKSVPVMSNVANERGAGNGRTYVSESELGVVNVSVSTECYPQEFDTQVTVRGDRLFVAKHGKAVEIKEYSPLTTEIRNAALNALTDGKFSLREANDLAALVGKIAGKKTMSEDKSVPVMSNVANERGAGNGRTYVSESELGVVRVSVSTGCDPQEFDTQVTVRGDRLFVGKNGKTVEIKEYSPLTTEIRNAALNALTDGKFSLQEANDLAALAGKIVGNTNVVRGTPKGGR